MNVDHKDPVSEKTPLQTKRPYAAPILSEYGDIRQITQQSMNGQKNDGGGGLANMTF